MLGEIGTILLGLSLAASIYAAFAAFWGIRQRDKRWSESGHNAVVAVTVMLGLAVMALGAAFLDNRFEIQYVAQHSSYAVPLYLKISAIWAGQEGSLLVWSFLQALFATLATTFPTKRARPLVPWAAVFLNLIAAFFIAVTLTLSNPFAQTPMMPADGVGLNPLLRHPGMIFHPPALYVGYVGLAVPFAFALAALVTRQLDGWTAAVRVWTLISWLGLSLGLLLGMRWAYDVLGWGGYWGWDPVENAGLMPWFTATALLHSSVMQAERRGFRIWNILLAIFSFVLVLFGTYATRSGVIQSVHAYARSNLGNYFLSAILVSLGGALGLLFWRLPDLKTKATTESMLSRDGMFFLTLLLFTMLTVSVFVGSVLPTITSLMGGRSFEAGTAWFDRVTGPQFGALVLLMGVCPLLGRATAAIIRLRTRGWIPLVGAAIVVGVALLAGFTRAVSLVGFAIVGLAGATTLLEYGEGVAARRRRTQEAPLNALWRLFRLQQRKYGGYLVHVGVILMAIGIIGTRMYPMEREVVVNTGESVTVGGYTLVVEALERERAADYTSTWARVAVYQGEDYLVTLQPRLNQYVNFDQTISVPALHPRLREDVYLILAGWSNNSTTVTFRVVINALANFLWLGGLVFMAGGLLALWPRAERWTVGQVVAVVVAVLLLVGAGWAMWGAQHGRAPRATTRPRVGQAAPDFRLTLLDDTTLSLADLRGKIAVVNIWASWCPTCAEELTDLQTIWEAYREQGVTFIGVAYQDDAMELQTAITQYGLTYPIGMDKNDRIAEAYGITGVPETFIVGPDGRIVTVYVGPVTADRLRADLLPLLAK